jgi:cell division protein FtsB
MAYAALNAYEQREEAIARRSVLSDELGRLEARAGSLTEDISRLEDPRGIETELRRRYDVGKEGEEVIVFIEREQETVPQEEHIVRKKTVLERLKGLFTGE